VAKIIAKRDCTKGPDGTVVAYRTKYYRYYDGKRASVGPKAEAVRIDDGLAPKVCEQLNAVAGDGWWVMDPESKPPRLPGPAKVGA
jgi:hypothetical protein